MARRPVRLVHPGAGQRQRAEERLAAVGPVVRAVEEDVLHGGRIHVRQMFFTSHFRELAFFLLHLARNRVVSDPDRQKQNRPNQDRPGRTT